MNTALPAEEVEAITVKATDAIWAEAFSGKHWEFDGLKAGEIVKAAISEAISRARSVTEGETVSKLKDALDTLLRSAFPNQRDNPSMFSAWEKGKRVLNEIQVEQAMIGASRIPSGELGGVAEGACHQ